jgi:hypothetical protein
MLLLQFRRLPSATQEKFARPSDISAAGRSICPELSAGLVAVKGKAVPAIDMPPRTGIAPPQAITLPQQERGGKGALLPPNFRIPADFRRSFKTYAARPFRVADSAPYNPLMKRAFIAKFLANP